MNIDKIMPQMIESVIKDIEYIERANKITVCIITLKNDFMVIGEAGVVRPELFNSEIGRSVAKKDAMDKIWFYLGVCLQQQINPIVLSDLI